MKTSTLLSRVVKEMDEKEWSHVSVEWAEFNFFTNNVEKFMKRVLFMNRTNSEQILRVTEFCSSNRILSLLKFVQNLVPFSTNWYSKTIAMRINWFISLQYLNAFSLKGFFKITIVFGNTFHYPNFNFSL